MDSTKLRGINEARLTEFKTSQKHDELLNSDISTRNTIVDATTSLITYLEGNATNTDQRFTDLIKKLDSVGTPDAAHVVMAVRELHDTLKTHENTDLTEITKVMQEILDEAKAIPKDHAEPQEQKFVDYTAQFKGLEAAVKAVGEFVKAQKLIAEAPVVNVPETTVNVEAPDFSIVQTPLKNILTAVKDIVIPEYKTDNAAVEKLLKETNKKLDKLIEKPVSRGGGGGGSAWAAVNTSGIPMPLNLNADGELKVDATINVGDIEIGAVEIKNGTDDTRLTVRASTSDATKNGIVVINPDGSNIGASGTTSATTGTISSVAGSTSTGVLLALNTSRKGALFFNDSTAILYLALAATASSTAYSVQIAGGAFYELSPLYTGVISGIWSAANGNARITELS